MNKFLSTFTAFFVSSLIVGAQAFELNAKNIQNCKAAITQKIYLSDNGTNLIDNNAIKNTDPNNTKKILELYDYLPALHKKVLCHIDRIQLHTDIKSVAYASMIQTGEFSKPLNLIGIKLDALNNDNKFDLFSWKEQINFGLADAKDPYFSVDRDGPQVSLKINKVKNPDLFYVLIHEINHLVDFMNQVTQFNCRQGFRGNDYNCKLNPGTFAKFSFPEFYTLNGDNPNEYAREFNSQYPQLSKFCFYDCQSFMSPDQVNSSYKALENSSFLTSYSITHMAEDFAEFATAHLLHELKLGYELKIIGENNKIIFDQNKQFLSSKNPELRAKKEWIKKFFDNRNIKYKW